MKKNPYFDMPGINSSVLGWVLPESGGSVEMYTHYMMSPPKVEGSAVDVGSALHKFIEFPDLFKVRVIDGIGPATKAVLDHLLKDDSITSLTYLHSEKVKDAVNLFNFQPGWKEETRIKKIIEEGFDYFEAVRTQDEYTAILGSAEKNIVDICSNQLRRKCTRIFAPELEYAKGVEIKKEVVLQFKHGDLQCKALIDRLILDHDKKQFQIEDLKTTSTLIPYFCGFNVPGLPKEEGEVMKRHIYRQMAFYTMAVHSVYPTYTPMNYPILLVQETVAPYRFEEYRMNADQMSLGATRAKLALSIIGTITESA